MYQIKRLIKDRRETNRRKGIRSAEVQNQRRMERMADAPVMPAQIIEDIEITVTRRVCGTAMPPQRYLLINEEGKDRANQYRVFDPDTQEFLGIMGIDKAMTEAGKRIPRMRRMD